MLQCALLRAGAARVGRAPVRRSFLSNGRWVWVDQIFNRVNHARIREVGADRCAPCLRQRLCRLLSAGAWRLSLPRAAAEFVLLFEGSMRIRGMKAPVTCAADLPSSGPLVLESVDLTNSAVSDIGLAWFAGCTGLRAVTLADSYLINVGCREYASISVPHDLAGFGCACDGSLASGRAGPECGSSVSCARFQH
jgi:hypothetical protein